MTTNTGARESSQTPIGFKQSDFLDKSIKSIEKEFTPEFRNRLTAIIQFNPLKPKIIESIAKKCLEECKLLLRDKNILLSYSEDVPSYLATKGYDKKFGARPIKRLVEQEIKQPLSNELLFGCLQHGGNVNLEIKNKIITILFPEKKSGSKKK